MTPLLLPLAITPCAPAATQTFAPCEGEGEQAAAFLALFTEIEYYEEVTPSPLGSAFEGAPLQNQEVLFTSAALFSPTLSQIQVADSIESVDVSDIEIADVTGLAPQAPSLLQADSPHPIKIETSDLPLTKQPKTFWPPDATQVVRAEAPQPKANQATPYFAVPPPLQALPVPMPSRGFASSESISVQGPAIDHGQAIPGKSAPLQTPHNPAKSFDPNIIEGDTFNQPQPASPFEAIDNDMIFIDLSDHEGVELLTLHRDAPSMSFSPEVTSPSEKSGAKAPQLSEQILAALPEQKEEVTELTLHPEELGTIRMEFRGDSDKLSLMITAERPETLDLLRRQAERLLHEMRSSGYGEVKLDFGQNSQGSRDQKAPRALPSLVPEGFLHEVPASRPNPSVETNRLYIRM